MSTPKKQTEGQGYFAAETESKERSDAAASKPRPKTKLVLKLGSQSAKKAAKGAGDVDDGGKRTNAAAQPVLKPAVTTEKKAAMPTEQDQNNEHLDLVPNKTPPGKLSAILAAGGGSNIRRIWDTTSPADDFGPLPSGEYVARIVKGELETSRTHGTPGYKIEFQVVEGEYAGRRIWHDLWLTPAAMPMAKRDLGKLRITSLEQLEQPVPQRIVCAVKLALRTEDDGTRHNKVRSFEVLRIETPAAEPFAPDDRPADQVGESEGGGH